MNTIKRCDEHNKKDVMNTIKRCDEHNKKCDAHNKKGGGHKNESGLPRKDVTNLQLPSSHF